MKSCVLLLALSGLAVSASAQTAPAPGVRMIEPGKETSKGAPSPAAAKPEPIKPAAVDAPAKKPEDHTTIDSEAVDIDTKNSISVFIGNVTVRNPQFRLTTDGVFEVYMKKQPKQPKADPAKAGDPKAGDTKKAPAPEINPGSAAKGLDNPSDPDSGVEKAIAKGKMVTIEKKDAEGNVKIGKSRHAFFDGKTEDITLSDWPQVQSGENVIIATEASTTMVLTKAGKLKVNGRARTDIVGNNPGGAKGNGQVTPGAPNAAR